VPVLTSLIFEGPRGFRACLNARPPGQSCSGRARSAFHAVGGVAGWDSRSVRSPDRSCSSVRCRTSRSKEDFFLPRTLARGILRPARKGASAVFFVSLDFWLTMVSSCFLIWLETVGDQSVPTLPRLEPFGAACQRPPGVFVAISRGVDRPRRAQTPSGGKLSSAGPTPPRPPTP
jgi:hypothetical protein